MAMIAPRELKELLGSAAGALALSLAYLNTAKNLTQNQTRRDGYATLIAVGEHLARCVAQEANCIKLDEENP